MLAKGKPIMDETYSIFESSLVIAAHNFNELRLSWKIKLSIKGLDIHLKIKSFYWKAYQV